VGQLEEKMKAFSMAEDQRTMMVGLQ